MQGQAELITATAGVPPVGHDGADAPSSLFDSGRNVWRVERAGRARVLIDGAQFFRAVREALRAARRNIFIVGWDIDSRCRLVGSDCEPDDGLPVGFADFLTALVRDRPDLNVHLLLWDYSVVYALERELSPTMALHWGTPPQVRLCLDDELPLGASHHQKIIVVDDALAFSGGLDLTIRRWDTSEHAANNPDRVDPSGKAYRPFHDVQMMVDGDAARALAELVRARWERASGDVPVALEPAGSADLWPESFPPDFRDVPVGIARTLPVYQEEPEVREVEALLHDQIASAHESIYIENQFLTCLTLAERLADALRRNPRLEVLMVGPRNYGSWIETHTMRNGRIRFMRFLEDAGVANQVRLVFPEVRDGDTVTDTMVHSKILIIDDKSLRVGSANLNNRSMGVDTECDLVLEAETSEHRAAIRRVRNRLLSDHCGTTPDDAADALVRTGSLLRASQELSARGHALRPIDDGEPDAEEFSARIEEVADPSSPLRAEIIIDAKGSEAARLPMPTLAKLVLAAMVVILLPLIWQYSPLAALTHPDTLRDTIGAVSGNAWAPLIVIGIFVVAGLVAFPVTLLIAVTAATFGPLWGFIYALVGALASALVTYGIGARLGKDMLRTLLGPRLDRIRKRVVAQGVLAVATIRLVPVAPYTFVNLVAGASQIRLQDYLVGTVLGLTPGVLVMSALGHQVFQIITAPSAGNIALLGMAIVCWIAISIGIQFAISRRRGA